MSIVLLDVELGECDSIEVLQQLLRDLVNPVSMNRLD